MGCLINLLAKKLAKPVQLFVLLSIRAYQLTVSPALRLLAGPGFGCRFEQSCSSYAYEAISRDLLKGSFLALKRLAHCQPFSRARMSQKTVLYQDAHGP